MFLQSGTRVVSVAIMGLFNFIPRRCRFHLQSSVVILVLLFYKVHCFISDEASTLNGMVTDPHFWGFDLNEKRVEPGTAVEVRSVRGTLNICDVCEKVAGESVPFYCSIKPDLEQCHKPICPKGCGEGDDGDEKSSVNIKLPYRPSRPYPVNLPKISVSSLPPLPSSSSGHKLHAPIQGRTFSNIRIPSPGFPGGRSLQASASPQKYNEETCELNSPNLARLKPGSKYIEYRPDNHMLQITDIFKIVEKFGLALAEFRYPTEWHSVEKSPILKTVSNFKLTEKEPRIFYAIGAYDKPWEHGDFRYPSDNTSLTFHVLNPAIFGRTDERCAVITSGLGSDKKHYLTTRLWHCDQNFDDKTKVAYALFMYPPGSICSRRSVEECTMLKNHQSGKTFHYMIEMGQTRKRFIYFFPDQRNWVDAQALCKAKGLKLLDLDPIWDDAQTVIEIIDRFLKVTKLSPSTMFWTAGRFENEWLDNKFIWETTKTYIWNYYQKEPAPYAFSFWDSQPGTSKKVVTNSTTDRRHRRPKIQSPCVALSLNPETGGERSKLNFKLWYCNFPMFPLCYKKVEDKGPSDTPTPPATIGTRPTPAADSCEKPPVMKPVTVKPQPTTTTTPKPTTTITPKPTTTTTPEPTTTSEPPRKETTTTNKPTTTTEKLTTSTTMPTTSTEAPTTTEEESFTFEEMTTEESESELTEETISRPPAGPITSPAPEYFNPFDPNTCKSESKVVRVLSSDSKYVAYEPGNSSFSIAQIKNHCIQFGLIPAEIRSPEDWESILKSGIDGYIQGDPGDATDQFYAIGMDDSKEAGKIRYNSDGGELLFSMFHPEGDASLDSKCAILDSVFAPDGSKGFMMLHDNCELMSNEKVAYGLCMFPRDSKCFRESKEEKAALSDPTKFTTIINIGLTETRSIFFTPHQRSWEGAKEYCERASLNLLDFDPKWDDTEKIIKIFNSNLVSSLEQFQLTPIWTSGKLEGKYTAKKGTWTTSGTELEFPGSDSNSQWRRLDDPELHKIREGRITNPCVEVSFDNVKKQAMFRPDYCDLPKYFLCYRKHGGRGDPPPENTLGITIIELM